MWFALLLPLAILVWLALEAQSPREFWDSVVDFGWLWFMCALAVLGAAGYLTSSS